MTSRKPVNLLIAGAQKCGTTALHYYLSQHPDIYLHPTKELHFFDDEGYWKEVAGKDDFDHFHKNFDFAISNKWVGEATPIYMFWESCAERIYFYNPDMKLIILLRDPAERAYSQWIMETRRGNENRAFLEAITIEISQLRDGTYQQNRVNSYVSRGFYASQIKRLLSFFSRQQILILQTELLKKSHKETLQTACEFLNIKSFPNIKPKEVFSNKYTRISSCERDLLIKNYTEDILEVQDICKFDCSKWLQSSHCNEAFN